MKKLLISIFEKLGYTIRKKDYQREEELQVINTGKAIINKISPRFIVLNGPFKGMIYPSIDITELTLVPKITGSYEGYLIPLINKILQKNYTAVLDIGCAEGYYAVGIAKKIPGSTVYCYDINKADLDFCRKMAEINNVANIRIEGACSPQTLINFQYAGPSLIFCDCEGYELDLFTDEVVAHLKNADVLIELHDIVNPVISETIKKRFSRSHDIILINNSSTDNTKLEGLDSLSAREKAFAVYEHRGGLYQNIFMEWAFFTPKVN